VDNACLFLEGRLPELARTLKSRMERAAAAEKFEEAARWRDLLRTIEDYRENVDNACLFLEGRMPELARTLKGRMERAAAEEKFEEAARWRDLLRTIEDFRDRPRTISTALEDQDAVGFVRAGGRAAAYVFFMRQGKIRNS